MISKSLKHIFIHLAYFKLPSLLRCVLQTLLRLLPQLVVLLSSLLGVIVTQKLTILTNHVQ